MNEFRSAISIGECANVSGNEINSVGTHDSVFIKWKYWCHQITVISRRIIVCFLQFAIPPTKRKTFLFVIDFTPCRIVKKQEKQVFSTTSLWRASVYSFDACVVCKWLMNPFFDQSNQARFRFARAFARKWNSFARHFQFLIFEITLAPALSLRLLHVADGWTSNWCQLNGAFVPCNIINLPEKRLKFIYFVHGCRTIWWFIVASLFILVLWWSWTINIHLVLIKDMRNAQLFRFMNRILLLGAGGGEREKEEERGFH